MKITNLVAVATVLGLSSFSIMAHDKLSTETNTQQIEVNQSRAAFFGLNDVFYVKTDAGVKEAQTLSAGDKLLVNSSGSLAMVTGKLIVKLSESIDPEQFAKLYDLDLDWKNNSNLVILAADKNADLLSLLAQLKADKRVVRVKLDKTIAKNSPM
ncbi:hypothetical protein [Shewanella surugensis]|uniref:ASP external chaperone domain-containing protein n=1 Tax=Shewanella surugensis TaxID=212020 RepID=A0ABT0L6M2_9GAMM|nr:hypothetical protein [Shewanella surugensis]MCL1123346.1 hypothetical protein [Shewanella surugensis]